MLWKLTNKLKHLLHRLRGLDREAGGPVGDSGVSSFGGKDVFATTLLVELRRMARAKMRHERWNHTLEPTELVGQLYLRLLQRPDFTWKDRDHFLLAASQAMRHFLVDYARKRKAELHGGKLDRVNLADIAGLSAPSPGLILDVDDALGRLAKTEPRMAQVVELKFFGGLTFEEIGKVLEIHERTVKRDWTLAREWLAKDLSETGTARDDSGRVGEN